MKSLKRNFEGKGNFLIKQIGRKKFEISLVDCFTGDQIVIDSHYRNYKPLELSEYFKLPNVIEIIQSGKPLYLFSV